jgi:deoxycytidylate deaminase
MTIKYPYLPVGREFRYVEESNSFMQFAKKVCLEHSTDMNHPTGAVIVKDNRIIGFAANRSALKNQMLVEWHSKGLCIRQLLRVRTGTKYWLCPGCASYKNHAERLAIRKAIEDGYDVRGADLYLYGHWWCCKDCWDIMINSGIKDVYLLKGSDKLFC